MSDEELIESLRLWNRDDAAARIEALTAKLAKAEAESEEHKRAFAAQSRKLQAVLHIGGVKDTLAEIKGESHA